MRIPKNIVIGLLFLIACQTHAIGQSRVDSLRLILDSKTTPASCYMKTTVEFCKTVANTDNEYLLPEYVIKGLSADTLTTNPLNFQSRVNLYEYLGNYYWRVGKLSEAAEQFNQMRLLGERNPNDLVVAKSLNGLGTVYYLLSNYDKALDYYRNAMEKSGTDTLLKVKIYNNIANTFTLQGKTDSVLPYYNKSLAYHQAHGNFGLLANVYANIALAYSKIHNGPAVRKNITFALEAANQANDPYRIASVYQTMGILSMNKHRELAIRCFNQSLDIARKSKNYDQISTNLEYLADMADTAGQYKKEAGYLREIKALADTLGLEHKNSRMQQLESEHKAAQKAINDFEKERSLQIKAVNDDYRERSLIVILSIVIAALLGLLLMRVQTYRLKTRINRTRERFFTMIAHDIRNPFSGILGLSGLLNEESENDTNLVRRKQIRTLHHSLNHVYELLENLLQWSQTESGKIAFNPVDQLLSPFVHETICLHATTAKQKGIRLENQVQSGLTARFDSNMFQTVIRNLLSNSIKFSPENSTIFISAEIQGNEVVVKVRDEGIGMTPAQIAESLSSEKSVTTPGTRNETGTGLGLMICKDFIGRHGGKIWAESTPGIGTTMIFTLPDRSGKN